MEVEGEKEANHAIIADFNFSGFSRYHFSRYQSVHQRFIFVLKWRFAAPWAISDAKGSQSSIIDFERAWHAYFIADIR
jgi:hypothetical protein